MVSQLHELPQVSCYKYSVTKKHINSKATFSSIEEIYDEEVVTLTNKKITCKKSAGELKTVIEMSKFMLTNF